MRLTKSLATAAALALLAVPAALAGKPAPLADALGRGASADWRSAPLGPTLRRFADVFSTPVWIDRRVDPAAPLTLSVAGQTVGGVLERGAAEHGLAAVRFDRVVYIGPRESALALHRFGREWCRGAGRAALRTGETRWPRLSTPADVAQGIAADAGLRIARPDAIPHDLWDAGSIPTMAAGDRLALVLVGFDLAWRPSPSDGRIIEVIPLRPADPGARLPPLGSADGPARTPPESDAVRYTLRVESQPLGPLLTQIAARLGLTFDRESLPAGAATRRVSFGVREASRRGLLAAIGESAGLTVRERDGRLVVDP